MDERDDLELLTAWRQGDNAAGSQLLRRHFRTLFRFFRSKINVGVDDLVQRTMLACAEGMQSFRGESSFRTYLLAIARTQLLMHLRSHARKGHKVDPLETSIADVVESPSVIVAGKDEQRLVLSALRAIPIDLQIAVELYYWEEMRVEDVAVVLGVPAGTIKSRLSRARRLVREQIERSDAATDDLREATINDVEGWVASLRDALAKR